MPDFDSVLLYVPYTADVVFRGQQQELLVDDAFDVSVASLSKSDTRLAAILRDDEIAVEFRTIEGKLFRTFLDVNSESWTAERTQTDLPPRIRLDPVWRVTKALRTSLLGSPFRPWRKDVSDVQRARAAKASPRAREAAEARLQTVITQGLRLVDGVLFQETRTPGWRIGGVKRCGADMPDLIDHPAITFIDPRIPLGEVNAVARKLDYDRMAGVIDIHDATLLPNTIEADALATFSVWTYKQLCRRRLDEFEPRHVMEALDLLHAAERAIREETPFDECYRLIELLADRSVRDDRHLTEVERHTSEVANGAREFLALKRALPPSGPEVIDDDEADDIAQGFRP